ncbi:NADH dehydrogenase FAD-containing subunit [Streptosporangium album]|uniref:NADH dehydrogenase FAD-containing subunit n=1 Tax=Streptosporangium album TaxID=47479 RepID=A0A7W7RWC6_9ACTN|nr:hypothetical protein [Streptosporangium album]MBB4939142.1 NADH dehydrogenase FAD-containing subunit [Streptosporangium album]
MMGTKARAYLMAALDRLGVTVRAGVSVVKVLPGGVELEGGEFVAGPSSAALESRTQDSAAHAHRR